MPNGLWRLRHRCNFEREGRRRVCLFSYLLGYSRRQYLRFVEAMDLPTTLREHVHAFHHLGGIARVCLYDNFKAVVLRHDADGVLYNPKFLAFATHYGFRPQACRVRRPQTKGKVERKFHYVESNLLNGRTFETLEHLNEVTAWWLANVADGRELRDFQETPRDRHERERALLLPLPAADLDTALMVYRHVNVEGYIVHRSNLYSVPWSHIGQVLPVRVTESEVIIYSVALEEIARHQLVPGVQTGLRQTSKSHHPADDPGQRTLLLQQRFHELGPVAAVAVPRRPAQQTGPGQTAKRKDCWAACWPTISGAMSIKPWNTPIRFGALLAGRGPPHPRRARPTQAPLDELADLQRETLDPLLREDAIGPRPTSDYQHLLTIVPRNPPMKRRPRRKTQRQLRRQHQLRGS